MFRKTAVFCTLAIFSSTLAFANQGDAIVSRNQVSLGSNSDNLAQNYLDKDQYLYAPKKTIQISGFYIGANLGAASLNSDDSSFSSTTASSISKDNGNFYTGFNLGFNYALNDMFAIGAETGFNYGYNLNEVSASGKNGDISMSIIPIFMTGSVMFPTGFNLFAKLGVAYVRESNSGFDSNQLSVSNGDGTANALQPALGFGVGYFIHNFNINVQYTHIFGDSKPNTSSSTFPVNALTLGLTYTFPSAFQ